MKVIDLIKVAQASILRTRGRAVLTMLGIVIGIASVIIMLSIGQAAQEFLLSQIASFGSDLVFIGNGSGDAQEKGPPSNAVKQSLTIEDYRALKRQSWVRVIDASLIRKDLVTAGSENKIINIQATAPGDLEVFNAKTAIGRFFTDEDVQSGAKFVVLGAGVARDFFGQSSPLDQRVTINKQAFRVIGVMQPGGTRFFNKVDDQVYIPITTGMTLYHQERINFISLKPEGITANEMKERIRLLLRDTHHIDNPQGLLSKDDFQVSTQEDAAKSAGMIGQILQILLASIAGISLVVAGIGIMNIMLVTVTERTQEIGLRKALGAQKRDILGQFLIESLFLTFVGGLIGVVIGLALSYGAITALGSFQPGWKFVFPLNAIFLASGVSIVIGLIFGYYPARKAAALRPIEALRHE